ncbi:MAG: flagellar basal body rod protein FlgB [Deltaproteobacteria bacterium]|nr:MAG: flagellar basal body rod protein FlgB [Deltaproteobacteria bacterium]
MIEGIFQRLTAILQKGIELSWLRQNLISANIANAETPGYKPREIDFEGEMKRFLSEGELRPLRTHPLHLPLLGEAAPQVFPKRGWAVTPDENGVDLEEEMAELAENYLRYTSLVQFLRRQLGMLRYSIREGGTF